MVMKSCFGCFHLKTGNMIIAILRLIGWTLLFFALLFLIIGFATARDYRGIVDLTQIAVNLSYLLIPVFVELVVGVWFIYGVAMEKKYFILPVLIMEMVELIAGTVLLIIHVVYVRRFENLSYLLLIGFGIFIWYCSYSFYKMLSLRRKDAQGYSEIYRDQNFISTEEV